MIKNKLFLLFGLLCGSLINSKEGMHKQSASVDKTMQHIKGISQLHAQHSIPFDLGSALYTVHKNHKKDTSAKSALVGHLISDYGPYMLSDDLQELYDYLAGRRTFGTISVFQKHVSHMNSSKKRNK